MGTTQLDTERYNNNQMICEMNVDNKVQVESEETAPQEDIQLEMFKKLSKPSEILGKTTWIADSGKQVLLDCGDFEEIISSEGNSMEEQIEGMRRSLKEVDVSDMLLVANSKSKKRRKKKRKKRWKGPKKMVEWNSRNQKRGKHDFEIEEVFHSNRSDFGESTTSLKDKVGNCMCKAF